MDTTEMRDWLYEHLGFEEPVASISTYDDAGILTTNEGLVIRLDDGSEFQLTIVQSRQEDPGTREPRIHRFDSTGEAYDASQTDDSIRDGDILLVEAEHAVAILTEAWPTATAEEFAGEHFHVLAADADWSSLQLTSGERRDYSASLAKAMQATAELPADEPEALGSRRAPAPSIEHDRVEDCTLAFLGHVAAPGYGISYECSTCGRPWLKVGSGYVDPREQLYELRPEDVI